MFFTVDKSTLSFNWKSVPFIVSVSYSFVSRWQSLCVFVRLAAIFFFCCYLPSMLIYMRKCVTCYVLIGMFWLWTFRKYISYVPMSADFLVRKTLCYITYPIFHGSTSPLKMLPVLYSFNCIWRQKSKSTVTFRYNFIHQYNR